jgi:polar amino acid transport system substrate-binding protein
MLSLFWRHLKNSRPHFLVRVTRHRPRGLCREKAPVHALLVLATASMLVPAPPVQSSESLPSIQVYTEVRNAANIARDQQGIPYVDNPATTLTVAVLEEAGLDYDIRIVPWARIMQILDTQPNTLAYSLARTPQRETRFLWVGEIRPVEVYLFGLRSRQAELPGTIEEARDFRIGTIRSDFADQYLRGLEFPNLVHIGNNTPWLTMMERGRIDLVPFGAHGIQEYLAQRAEPQEKLLATVHLDALSTGLYLALSKQTDPAILKRLRQAYQRLVEDGTYQRIMALENTEN